MTHEDVSLCAHQACTEGGESWRCQEDKRHGGGGTCDFDSCNQCMEKQGVQCLYGVRPIMVNFDRYPQQRKLSRSWRQYNRQASIELNGGQLNYN